MGEGEGKLMAQDQRHDDSYGKSTCKDQWVIMEAAGDDDDDDTYNTTSLEDSSSSANESTSSSSDVVDDASSSSTSSSSSLNSNGPLFELSELMAHLPMKRGLSKFYQGRSQSYTCLSRVTSIEDLAKKVTTPYRKRMKASKSYENGLNAQKSYTTLPKPMIAKKISRGSLSSLSFPAGRRGSFLNSNRPPPIPVQKEF